MGGAISKNQARDLVIEKDIIEEEGYNKEENGGLFKKYCTSLRLYSIYYKLAII